MNLFVYRTPGMFPEIRAAAHRLERSTLGSACLRPASPGHAAAGAAGEADPVFPIRDENPTAHRPITTFVIIAANVLVWGGLQGFGFGTALPESLCLHALIPGDLLGSAEPGTIIRVGPELGCRIDGDGSPLTLLSSMFMHGSWLHIIGNLWFLWIFGDNVEDVMGPLRFVAFYLLCGLVAAAAQIVHCAGLHRAHGGCLRRHRRGHGGLRPALSRARVHMLVFFGFFVTTISVPALFMLGYWFLLQLVSGLPSLGDAVGGVAFWAHIGGFLAGVGLSWVFVRDDLLDDRMRRPPRKEVRRLF
ncbi:MAG: rhomboid family intramembrane serine protease [Gammaproteobacteria bacterium]|nr:rhomboid family intramembrane serine protease [Gammaproteobacteria bacterium]